MASVEARVKKLETIVRRIAELCAGPSVAALCKGYPAAQDAPEDKPGDETEG